MSHVTCHMAHVMCPVSHVICHMSHIICHISFITYHLSPITYHLSPITYHLSPVTCHLSLSQPPQTPSLLLTSLLYTVGLFSKKTKTRKIDRLHHETMDLAAAQISVAEGQTRSILSEKKH